MTLSVSRLTTTFEPVSDGTKVTVPCENAPAGIKDSDHLVGIESSLANLAAFTK